MWLVTKEALVFVGRTRAGIVVSSPIEGDLERAFPAAAVWHDAGAALPFFAYVTEAQLTDALVGMANGVRDPELTASIADPVRRAGYLRALGALCDAFGGHGRLGWRRTRRASPKDAYLSGERPPAEVRAAL